MYGGIFMIDPTQCQFFLGANTPEGFHSLYSQLLPTHNAKAIYILQGGPACGKSALLRQLATEATARGHKTQEILCPANPDTLDALILPDKNIAIADGSPPHTIQAKHPGLIEHYINLGDCYHNHILQENRNAILSATQAYKETSAHSLPALSTAGELSQTISNILQSPKLTERLHKRATGILNRDIKVKPKAQSGAITQRFLSANTPQGRITLFHTATQSCDKIYQLWDSYGIAHGILMPLLTGAVQRGHSAIACLNPMNPAHLEHLILPELSLAFLSSSPSLPLEGEHFRKIRLETMLDSGLLKQNRSRLRIYRKMYHSLLDEIVHIQADNLSVYQKLEEIYHTAVNFDQVSALTASLGETIFQDGKSPKYQNH